MSWTGSRNKVFSAIENMIEERSLEDADETEKPVKVYYYGSIADHCLMDDRTI